MKKTSVLPCLGILLIGTVTACVTAPSEQPEAFFSVFLNSLPSGASIYAANADGTLGALIGTTPYQWRLGISSPRFFGGPTPNSAFSSPNVWAGPGIVWGHGSHPELGANRALFLNVAVVREGYITVWVQNKLIADLGNAYPPANVSMTVPLQSLSGSSSGSTQQQQQQQQIIIINQ